MIEVKVNGEVTEISQTNLNAFLSEFANGQSTFAVAINQTFVPRSNYATTELQAGDDIEILSPMQGG